MEDNKPVSEQGETQTDGEAGVAEQPSNVVNDEANAGVSEQPSAESQADVETVPDPEPDYEPVMDPPPAPPEALPTRNYTHIESGRQIIVPTTVAQAIADGQCESILFEGDYQPLENFEQGHVVIEDESESSEETE